jgi:glycosyltransferase involved in cell wall biosynthesis
MQDATISSNIDTLASSEILVEIPTQTKRAIVIIPVLNEADGLNGLLNSVTRKVLDIDVDILVINDGSEDDSAKIAFQNNCVLINHDKRVGHGASVREGCEYAIKNGYDYIVKMDGDGQHDPRYLTTIIKILAKGNTDCVISSRYLRKIDQVTIPPIERKVVNGMVTGAINRITKSNYTDAHCGIFGFRTAIYNDIDFKTKDYGVVIELILKAHFRNYNILEIPHPTIYKESKGSKFEHVYGKKNTLGARLEAYTQVILSTLAELGISDF